MSEELFNPEDSLQDNIVSLAQGNPGAVTVLTELVDYDPSAAVLVMDDLSKMDMYGPRIWIVYSDYCDEDIEEFVEAILGQKSEMIEMVNEHLGDDEEPIEKLH